MPAHGEPSAIVCVSSPHPNAVESALLRGLEEQNNTLQLHVAWLSKELARSARSEAAQRENLAVVTSRFLPSSAAVCAEVKELQGRLAETGSALAGERERARAAESCAETLRETLLSREAQVLQLSVQLGRAAAHVRKQASTIAGWSERQPTRAPPAASDMTTAKFEMQQLLLLELTQQLAEAKLEAEGCQAAADVWEARHMMWEQTIEATNPPMRNGSAVWSAPRVPDENGADEKAPGPSLLQAERAWRERCEAQRRREETSSS
ncbi:hypothetical protein T492DRAFT_999992 [Pavlovales sp. CCMP2436]|nr:hypothetical protein T492DRAFT_999992 [Pavlovales sp. CCMP2436]